MRPALARFSGRFGKTTRVVGVGQDALLDGTRPLRLREWLHALEVEFPTFVNTLDQELKRQEAALVT